MVVRVRGFCRAHPLPDAGYAPALAQLEARIVHMEALARQEQGGVARSHASTVRRRLLRRRLHDQLLRHLVTVADVAAAAQPGLAESYELPNTHLTNEAFRTHARRLFEAGHRQQDLLTRYGLADALLGDLGAAVDEFDASVAQSNEARRDHVGARAELKAVSAEVMRLVEMLDGLHRYRFSGNAELKAAWDSARNVVTGPRPAAAANGDARPAA